MAATICMKRMARERATLEKPNIDYFVHFNDDNLLKFEAYVFGPTDTLYAHKFLKIRFEIPDRYPLVPPKCTFIQHSGGRIHPNLYVEGKVCLSILGTWPGEPWALAMTCETVLITVRSLLDNQPYKHEPHQRDNPQFNQYVQYTTWKSLLIDYVKGERNEAAKAFLEKYVSEHGNDMMSELQRQKLYNRGSRQLQTPYGGPLTIPNYDGLLRDVEQLIIDCRQAEEARKITIPTEADCGADVGRQDVSDAENTDGLTSVTEKPTSLPNPTQQLLYTNERSHVAQDVSSAPTEASSRRIKEVIDLT